MLKTLHQLNRPDDRIIDPLAERDSFPVIYPSPNRNIVLGPPQARTLNRDAVLLIAQAFSAYKDSVPCIRGEDDIVAFATYLTQFVQGQSRAQNNHLDACDEYVGLPML